MRFTIRKYLCFVCASLLYVLNINAQEQTINKKFTVGESVQDIILELEESTAITFYFDQVWLQNKTIPESYVFEEASLDDVLNTILATTELNYTILEGKVILSKNVNIYTGLADKFIPEKKKEYVQDKLQQVFYKEYKPSIYRNEQTVYIGKKTSNTGTAKLSGRIIDQKTGAPLADIVLKTADSKYYATSDVNGYYTITLPVGKNVLEVSATGFETLYLNVFLFSSGSKEIQLAESITKLSEVVVTSTQNEIVENTVTGVTTIDVAKVKNIPMVLGERDVLKVATIMPGIKTVGEGSSGFNVRGGKSDQNLILLDEGLIYNPFHFFGFFSSVNPYTVEKVDIYKGSIPAKYGGRLSSVFDIKTKKGDTEKFSGEGGIGPVTSNLMLTTPIVKGKSALTVGGRLTYSDWILKRLDDENLKDSQASFYDVFLKYSHDINENNGVEATAYYSKDKYSLTSDSLYKYSNRMFAVSWNHVFDEKNRFKATVSNTQYRFNIDFDDDVDDLYDFDLGYVINETQLQANFNYRYSPKHLFQYGLSTKLYDIQPGNLETPSSSIIEPVTLAKERGLESAVYLGDEITVSDKLKVNLGLRYSTFTALGKGDRLQYLQGQPFNDGTVTDTISFGNNEAIKTYGGLEYRASARYFITEDFSVKGSFDTNYQYIHLLSTNTTQAPTDTWKLSDLHIKPESSQQYSLGFYKNFNNSGYELSVEGYYKKMKNVLDYKVGAEILLNDYIEQELIQAEGKAYGVEVLLKKPEGKLNGWLGYTYSRTFLRSNTLFNDELINNGEYFPANYDKPHDFSLVLNYKLTKRYSFSANFVYQTGRPITYPVGQYQYGGAEYTLYSDRNQFRIPDYYRLDIGVNIEGNHKIKKLAHSFWNFSIYNVLGRNNPYSVYFVTESGEIKAYQTSIFAIPVPTITYNFKF